VQPSPVHLQVNPCVGPFGYNASSSSQVTTPYPFGHHASPSSQVPGYSVPSSEPGPPSGEVESCRTIYPNTAPYGQYSHQSPYVQE
jgi:hypothetical protein